MTLRRPRPVQWLRDHPRHADWLLAILLTGVGVTVHLVGIDSASPSEERDAVWWSVPLAVLCVLPIAWRRVRPIEVAVAVTAAQLVFTLLDFVGPGFLGVIVALYSMGAHSSGPRRQRVLIGATIAIGLLFVAGLLVDELVLADFLFSTGVLVTAFVLGDNLRRRREAAAAMAERAERAERERDLLAHQRVAAERARISRELHDVVAHSVSAMVIQASAARRSLEHSPDRTAEALGNIEAVGRRAMDELRAMLGVLRADADGETDEAARVAAPQPTLGEIPALLAESSDLPLHVSIADDLEQVPSAVGLVAYRLVQEALTNVRRHAGEVTRVDVTIDRVPDAIHIEVLDDGRGLAADDAPDPSYGVQGMHERVAALGGFIVAEHRVGGGWQVYAELPIRRGQRAAGAGRARVSR